MGDKITIKDIGRLAGCSHTTVSRALNGSPLVGEATRAKIEELARRLDFEFDAAARSLSGRRTGVVAVVYSACFEAFGSSLYVNQLFHDVRRALGLYGLDMILAEARDPRTGNGAIRRLARTKKVDAFLVVHEEVGKDDYAAALDAGLPVVHLHLLPRYFPLDGLDSFTADNFEGGRIAALHLARSGCARPLNLTIGAAGQAAAGDDEFAERSRGFLAGLAEAGLDPEACPTLALEECSNLAAYRLVRARKASFGGDGFDAIFAQADIAAFGCLQALKEAGVAVPGRVKVLGYDDTPLCAMSEPALSSVHQPREELAEAACARIAALLDGSAEAGRTRVVRPPVLAERESTAP